MIQFSGIKGARPCENSLSCERLCAFSFDIFMGVFSEAQHKFFCTREIALEIGALNKGRNKKIQIFAIAWKVLTKLTY